MTGTRVRRRAWTIAALVLLLMIVRVDFWWWGADMPPVLFGTFNVPMLYNLVIFLAGWALVVYTAGIDDVEAPRS